VLRADTHPPDMRPDYTFDFNRKQYRDEDHAIWHILCDRMKPLLKGRACDEYIKALEDLGILTEGGIPDFERISNMLEHKTGWRLVTVPGLIPGEVFLKHLSERRFPVTWWIRERTQLDYLQEPDVFHDLFGHVPLLNNPVFADYMQLFGKGAVKAETLDASQFITRLYWFTVEFGLINTKDGVRIYGSGIVSSAKETVYAVESPKANRIGFDLLRIMRSDYYIDDVQKTYFVIDSFEQLFEQTKPDFAPYYEQLKQMDDIPVGTILPSDKVITLGTL
jgi:phenylalanine-4-hydroxylase